MVLVKSLNYDDIVKNLNKEEDVITIIGCNTCIRVSGAGGPDKMKELAMKLRNDGYNVLDGFMLPIACMEPYLFTASISPSVNTIIALSCSAGWSNMKRNMPHLKVIQTVDDIGLMIGDASKGVLKLLQPYEIHKDKIGNEYAMCSDGKLMAERQIPIDVEVHKK